MKRSVGRPLEAAPSVAAIATPCGVWTGLAPPRLFRMSVPVQPRTSKVLPLTPPVSTTFPMLLSVKMPPVEMLRLPDDAPVLVKDKAGRPGRDH